MLRENEFSKEFRYGDCGDKKKQETTCSWLKIVRDDVGILSQLVHLSSQWRHQLCREFKVAKLFSKNHWELKGSDSPHVLKEYSSWCRCFWLLQTRFAFANDTFAPIWILASDWLQAESLQVRPLEERALSIRCTKNLMVMVMVVN